MPRCQINQYEAELELIGSFKMDFLKTAFYYKQDQKTLHSQKYFKDQSII